MQQGEVAIGSVPPKMFPSSAPYGSSPAANVLNPVQPTGLSPQTPLLPPNFQDPGTMASSNLAQSTGIPSMAGGGNNELFGGRNRMFGRGLFGLVTLLFLSASSWATTTVTGTLKNLGTGTVSGGAFVRFWLRGCQGVQPRVNGNAVIAPTQGGVFYQDFVADVNGNISGTVYSTRDATGNLNGEIECPSSVFTATWYGVQLFLAGKAGPETPVAAKNGATLNVTNVTPLSASPVVTAPTGDTVYLRLDGGNSPVTGPVTFNNSLTVGGTTTLSGLVAESNWNNALIACNTSLVWLYQTMAAAYAALPATGGMVLVCSGHQETFSTPLTMNIASSGFKFLGKARISCPVAGCIIVPAGTHGVYLQGTVPFGNVFTADTGAQFIYSGSGKAMQIGASSTSTRQVSFNNIAVNIQGASAGASAWYLTSVVHPEMRMLSIIGNNVAGTFGIVCDGTGNYTGGGHILNPYIAAVGTGILGTGPATTTMNAMTILGGTISSAVAGGIGIDIENGSANYIVGTDIESESIALKFGATATNNYFRIRSESNTTDVTALSGATSNIGQTQSVSGTIVVSDSGTDNHFTYTTNADFNNVTVRNTLSLPAPGVGLITALTATANEKYINFSNTGNAGAFWGLEGSVAGAFPGSQAYDSLFWNQGSNHIFLKATQVRFSGNLSANVAGASDVGTAALPFGKQFLQGAPVGTAGSVSSGYDSTTGTEQHNSNNNGASSFSGAWNCTNVTPVTVNANVATDQNMMACTIPAGTLNRVGRTLRVKVAGIYSTPAASTSQVTVKVKICSVSGCGSGNVLTALNIQSTAIGTVQITNDNFSLRGELTTQTAGAALAEEAHGEYLIDLATLTTAADSVFGDGNTATQTGTPSAIDSTAQNFLQVTIAFSAASASNVATQRQLIAETVN